MTVRHVKCQLDDSCEASCKHVTVCYRVCCCGISERRQYNLQTGWEVSIYLYAWVVCVPVVVGLPCQGGK